MNSRVGVTLALGCLALAGSLAAQTITEFPVPTFTSTGLGMAAGPDGNLWFTEFTDNKIGRITTDGGFAEFPTTMSHPYGIAAGSDGSLWFTEWSPNNIGTIGRITTAGVITEFSDPLSRQQSSRYRGRSGREPLVH